MSELGMMAEQLRLVRQAEQEFLLRAAIDNLIIEPMFLDGLLQAVQDAAAPDSPSGEALGLFVRPPLDDET